MLGSVNSHSFSGQLAVVSHRLRLIIRPRRKLFVIFDTFPGSASLYGTVWSIFRVLFTVSTLSYEPLRFSAFVSSYPFIRGFAGVFCWVCVRLLSFLTTLLPVRQQVNINLTPYTTEVNRTLYGYTIQLNTLCTEDDILPMIKFSNSLFNEK